MKPLTFQEFEPALWNLCDSNVQPLTHPGPHVCLSHTFEIFEPYAFPAICTNEIWQTGILVYTSAYRRFRSSPHRLRLRLRFRDIGSVPTTCVHGPHEDVRTTSGLGLIPLRKRIIYPKCNGLETSYISSICHRDCDEAVI